MTFPLPSLSLLFFFLIVSTLLDVFVLVDSSIPFEGVIRDNTLVVLFCYGPFFTDHHCMYDIVDRAGRESYSKVSPQMLWRPSLPTCIPYLRLSFEFDSARPTSLASK